MDTNRIIYRILVKDASGNNLGEFNTFRNLQFGKKLNNFGTCTFDVPVNDPKSSTLIALRVYSVWIYRNEDLLWAGEQATRQGTLDDKGDNWVKITCYDWFEQLNSRYTADDIIYTGVDAGQIAWDLIDTAQSETHGDFGITEGDIEITQDRDREYKNNNVGDAIINLSNVINGFDFEINTSKVFNVKTVIGVDRSNEIVLEYGTNVRTMSITEDFSKPVTRAIVLGNSVSLGQSTRIVRNDTGQQAIYKIREQIDNEMTVSETSTLNDKGDALLRKYGSALLKVTMGIVRETPAITDFSLGDLIRLIVKTGSYDIDEIFRVFEWQVTYDINNSETLNLTLGNFYLPLFS